MARLPTGSMHAKSGALRQARRRAAWAAALLLLAVGAPTAWERAPAEGYAGSDRCAICHFDSHADWKRSRHSRMVQKARPDTVLGDFGQGSIALHDEPYVLHREGDEFFITESYITRKPVKRRVDFTLGTRRIQHYLSILPNGRIVLLVPSWDVQKKRWFHNMEVVDPEFDHGAPVQVWNKDCLVCHVSGADKRYDSRTRTYDTIWSEVSNNCERCHGPGDRHVRHHLLGLSGERASVPAAEEARMVVQTELDHVTNSMVCAQCHAFRAVVAEGFRPGDNIYDYFMPILEYAQVVDNDPTWWPDGRTRRFSNNAGGIWQTRCFLEGGLTCTQCHVDSHVLEIEENDRLRPTNNALCTRCHAAIGEAGSAHTHHAPESAGSSCVECHMPYTTTGINHVMRDHTISIPVPENTRDHGVSNACTTCHADRSPEWALDALQRWYPGSTRRQKWVRRAEAYSGGRERRPAAVAPLVAILQDASEGPLPRANAAGYLGNYGGNPRAVNALLSALQDDHPQVRGVAAEQLGRVGRKQLPEVRSALLAALLDPRRVVRTNAAMSLLEMGVAQIDGEPSRSFAQAKNDLEARAALHPDSPTMQFSLGKMYLLDHRPAAAVEPLEQSLQLDPEAHRTRLALAQALLASGRPDRARPHLERFRPSDPYYAQARRLLQRLPPASGSPGGSP